MWVIRNAHASRNPHMKLTKARAMSQSLGSIAQMQFLDYVWAVLNIHLVLYYTIRRISVKHNKDSLLAKKGKKTILILFSFY